ncbi:aldo/keto reductase [Streptomyces sp.]|uniref:aldo/keto reductase n=1 Tax=Streptomyces sp. TaxID=1931 RepID=UPI002812020E|nr:aldo/keto reductase [Streptomyces sp.]
MHTRRIGDVEASAIGLGAMPMSIEGRPDEARSLAGLHAAPDAGVTLIDTADACHRGAGGILGGRSACVQNQFSPAFRSSGPEPELCDGLGVAFLPRSPFGGISRAGEPGSAYAPFARIAEAHRVSPHRMCLAWTPARSPVVVPIPGASRPQSVRDATGAADLVLTADEVAEPDAA